MISMIIFILSASTTTTADKPCALSYEISRVPNLHTIPSIHWKQISEQQQLIRHDDRHKPQYLASFKNGQMNELKVAYPQLQKGIQFYSGDLKTIGLSSFKSLMMQQMNIKNPKTETIQNQVWQNETVEFSQVSNGLQSIQLQWHPIWQWPVSYMAKQATYSYQVKLSQHQFKDCEQAAPDWKQIEWMDFADLGDNEADDFAKQFINMGHTDLTHKH